MSADWTAWAENRHRVRNRRALVRTAEPPPPPRATALAIDFRTNDYLGLGGTRSAEPSHFGPRGRRVLPRRRRNAS